MPDVAQTRLASWRRREPDALLDSPKVATRARVKTAPSNRAALRPYVNRCREVLRYCCCGRRQKSLHFLGRYKPYKPCLVLAGRRRPDAAAAAREAQLALPRCHRASRARLTGLALAGGSLCLPRARDADSERSAVRWPEQRRRLVHLAVSERTRDSKRTPSTRRAEQIHTQVYIQRE